MSKALKIGIAVAAIAVLVVGTVLARKASSDDTWLGISPETITYRLAKKMDLPVKSGVYVSRVYRKSPAREAGLKRGDVITAVDGKEVTDSEDLSDMIDDHAIGDEITLTVNRDGTQQELKATLEEAPRSSYSRSFSWNDDDDDEDVVVLNRDNWGRSWNRSGWERPFLGVSLQDLNKQLGEYFGVERGRGALVTEVEEDSPAAEAGLKAGDVIIEIDGDLMRDAEDVIDAVGDREVGDKINITVKRQKNDMKIEAELAESDGAYDGFYGLNDGRAPFIMSIPDIPAIPDVPDVPDVPYFSTGSLNSHIRYLSDHDGAWFGMDREELEELRESMKDLNEELRDMKIKVKNDVRRSFQTSRSL